MFLLAANGLALFVDTTFFGLFYLIIIVPVAVQALEVYLRVISHALRAPALVPAVLKIEICELKHVTAC